MWKSMVVQKPGNSQKTVSMLSFYFYLPFWPSFVWIYHAISFITHLPYIHTLVMSTLIQTGFDPHLGNHNHFLVSNAGGFSQTQQKLISIPLGWLWDDVVGRAFANDYQIGLQGLKIPLSEAWGISGEEYDNRLKAMVHEWNHVEKAYANYRVVVARRSFTHIDIDDPK